MSTTKPSPGSAPAFPAVEAAVEQTVRDVGPHLAGLLQHAAPTPELVRSLGDELVRAGTDGRNVAHPELLDPNEFWQKAAWPQAAAVVKQGRRTLLAVADEIAAVVRGSEQVLDGWLVAAIDASITRADQDPSIARDAAIDGAVQGCEALHDLINRLRALAPSGAHLAPARAVIDQARPADPHHLNGLPYRHQDLLLTAHQKAADALAADVDAMVEELTKPILGIGERAVRRYDELAGAPRAAAPPAPAFGDAAQ